MSKRLQQGGVLRLVANVPTSDDYKRSSLTEDMVVDAIGIQFVVNNGNAMGSVEIADVLRDIDIRVVKDSTKTLIDMNALGLTVINKIESDIQHVIPAVPAAGSVAFTVIVPFQSPDRKRPEDTSLVVKSCRSLMVTLNNRCAIAGITIDNDCDTVIMYEEIGQGLPVNGERYIRREGVNISAASQNHIRSFDKYPYTRMIIDSADDLADIIRLDIYGNNKMVFTGEPDELDIMGQYMQGKDTVNEHQLATGVALNTQFLVLPLLKAIGDGIGKALEQPLKVGFYTSAAFDGNVILESISFPSVRRVTRDVKSVYGNIPPSAVRIGVVGQDGSQIKDVTSLRNTKGNISVVKITPVTETDVVKADNMNSKDMIKALSRTNSDTVDSIINSME